MRALVCGLILSSFLFIPAADARSQAKSRHVSNKEMRKRAIYKPYKKNKKQPRAKWGSQQR
jgi:hypothetical protein